ncbi:MAG: dynamin family protein [Hormoscilla sp.]
MELEKLGQYKEYGESVLQGLEGVKQPLPDWVPLDLRHSLESLRQAATKTVERASSPVKIGVMGEFSSGKTLLLGSLIGYADALPVSQTPTTGNVTAVHLRQADSLGTTKVDQFTIKYLSHSEVKECLKFMLEETAQRARAAQLPQVQQETLKNLTPTQTVDSNAILKWCEQAWNAGQNSELRSLLREMVTFVRTYSAYGQDICDRVYQVDAATAEEGLRLADPPMGILEQDFATMLEESALPATGSTAWQNLAMPSAKDLLHSFSLIRRVDVTITVSKQIWNLEALEKAQEFVILDFPGLGAADSGVRDKFLSLRELKEVQTILLLLNGGKPGGDAGAQIRNMMEQDKGVDLRDRILVGVGRFNQLPLTGTDQKNIDELIGFFGDDRPPLEEAEVLQELKILNLTVAGARNLTTEKDRIVLLSQMWALQELAERFSTLQVGSPEFAPELENYLGKDDETRLRQKWQELSEKLIDSGATKILRRQLRDFVDDGGIGRLRDLIVDHVQEYGVKQLYEDTRRQAEALRKELNKLKGILEIIPDYIPTTESQEFVTLRESIENMVRTYRKFKEDLEKKPLQNNHGVAVSEVVKSELIFSIHNWKEWNLLFNKMASGTIEPPRKDGGKGKGVIGRGKKERGQKNPLPTSSDDFYETFAKTMAEMEKFAGAQIRQAVLDMLSQLSGTVEVERSNISKLMRPEMEEQIETEFGESEADLFNILQEATDPKQWTDPIIEESSISENSPIDPEKMFPLARGDEKHQKIGQVFDWSPDKKHPARPKPFNHQMLVLRLRDEMSASAGLNLVQYVSEKTEKVKYVLQETLEVTEDMSELLRNERLLRYIATSESDSKSPAWLQTLSQTASISYPD